MSATTRRRLVQEAAERSDANPVFEIRGVPVGLTPKHHDVLVASLAARSMIETKPPELPSSVIVRQLDGLVNSLAESEPRGVNADQLKPPLPYALRSRKRR